MGLANFRIHCMPDPEKKTVAQSQWNADEEWGIIWCPDDEAYTDPIIELTVLHELGHGLLEITIPRHNYKRSEIERFCNRLARIALGNWHTLEPGEAKALAGEETQRRDAKSDTDEAGDDFKREATFDYRTFLPFVIDSLPTRERDVVNAIYYETVSFREIARRNGEDEASVRRTHVRALAKIKARLEALEGCYDEYPER